MVVQEVWYLEGLELHMPWDCLEGWCCMYYVVHTP